MTTLLLSALTSLLALVVIFVPLEFALPARQQPALRRALATDLLFFLGQNLLFAYVAIGLLRALTGTLGATPVATMDRGLPAWLLAVVVVVAGDFLAYWGHRLQHALPMLWHFHAVHHTADELDWLAAHREHPLDGLYTQSLINLPAVLVGFHFNEVLGLVAFRSLYAIFIHSNTSLHPGRLLSAFVGAPALHRVHHRRLGPARNFGNLSPYWDIVFGTHEAPGSAEDPLGIPEGHPRTYLELLVWPFQRCVASSVSILDRAWRTPRSLTSGSRPVSGA